MKQIIFLLLFCLSLASCEEEKDSPTPTANTTSSAKCNIENEIVRNIGDSLIISNTNYIYDSLLTDRLITKEFLNNLGQIDFVRQFNYSSNGEFIDILESSNGISPFDTTNSWIFNSQGNLISITSYLVGSSNPPSYNFTYSGSNLSTIKYIDPTSNTETYAVQIKDGNLIKQERIRINNLPVSSVLEIRYEYDNAINPYYGQPAYALELIKYFSKNNLTKTTVFQDGIEVIEFNTSLEYSANSCPNIIQADQNNTLIQLTY